MAFPFLPGGLLLAIAVLGGGLLLFGLALRALDRAATAGRQTMLPSLVAGFRTWVEARPKADDTPTSASEAEVVEILDQRIPDDAPRA